MAEDMNTYKMSCYDSSQNHQHAKGQYTEKVECYYTGTDVRRMWQGQQSIKDYKGGPSRDLSNDVSVPCTRVPAIPEDRVISLSEVDVSKVFNLVNTY